ncbi:MAG: hypothetical protein AAFX39_04795 [Pseudomonadota bacterium]
MEDRENRVICARTRDNLRRTNQQLSQARNDVRNLQNRINSKLEVEVENARVELLRLRALELGTTAALRRRSPDLSMLILAQEQRLERAKAQVREARSLLVGLRAARDSLRERRKRLEQNMRENNCKPW